MLQAVSAPTLCTSFGREGGHDQHGGAQLHEAGHDRVEFFGHLEPNQTVEVIYTLRAVTLVCVLFGIYWRRAHPDAAFWSIVAGFIAATLLTKLSRGCKARELCSGTSPPIGDRR